MKCALFGTKTLSDSSSQIVDISSLNLTSSEDYMVILSGDGNPYSAAIGSKSVYLSAKTSTSFTITNDINASFAVSYQVITFN